MAIDRTRPEPGCSAARNCAFTSVMSLPGFNLILMSCAHISHPPLPDLAFPRRPGQHTIDDLSRATPLDQPQHRYTWRPTRTGTERGRRVGRSGGVRAQDHGPELDSCCGAGDENRTRTISLGMSARMPLTSASAGRQAVGLSVSTCEALLLTYPSGT